MKRSSVLRKQWDGYAHYHQSRSNLLLHIVFVPLFLAGNVVFLVELVELRWLWAIAALALSILCLGIQGHSHRREPVPPEPFTGPADAVSRIVLEQWVSFPQFVLRGGWMRALRTRSGTHDARGDFASGGQVR